MSELTIAEKLQTITQNMDAVYNAGIQIGKSLQWELVERINLFETDGIEINYDKMSDDEFGDGLVWHHYYVHAYADCNLSGTYKIILHPISGLNFPEETQTESFVYYVSLVLYWNPKLGDESSGNYCQIYTDMTETSSSDYCKIITLIDPSSTQPLSQPNANGGFILKPKADGSYDVPTEWWLEIYKLSEA